ncbi:MAG: DUF975 family protein [Phycisphaerae bacterium]
MRSWYTISGNYRYGPVDDDTLRLWASQGCLNPWNFVWTQGMGQWVRGDQVPGLFAPVARWPKNGIWLPPVAPPNGTGGTRSLGQIASVASQRLRGRMGGPIGFCFLLALLQFGIYMIPLEIGKVATLVLAGPFALGQATYFLSFIRGGHTRTGMMFCGFSHFGNALLSYLLRGILAACWGLAGIFVGFTGLTLTRSYDQALWGIPLMVTGLLLGIPGYWAYAGYSMTFYILADNPRTGPLAAIRKSKQLMKGRRLAVILLWLRYMVWFALALLPLLLFLTQEPSLVLFGVFASFAGGLLVTLFVFPRLESALAVFYQDLLPPPGRPEDAQSGQGRSADSSASTLSTMGADPATRSW